MRTLTVEMERLKSEEIRAKFELLMMTDTDKRYLLFLEMGFNRETVAMFNLNQSPAACWGSVMSILETWRNTNVIIKLYDGIQRAELPVLFQQYTVTTT